MIPYNPENARLELIYTQLNLWELLGSLLYFECRPYLKRFGQILLDSVLREFLFLAELRLRRRLRLNAFGITAPSPIRFRF
jgi:hypothetical protein